MLLLLQQQLANYFLTFLYLSLFSEQRQNHLYYVLKQKRKHYKYKDNWQPVSLYDSEDYFRGPAIFETEKEARSYMKKYQLKIQAKNDSNMSNNQDKKINIQLKIFKENEKLEMNQIPSFFFSHRQ
jgi:hypothetical protein